MNIRDLTHKETDFTRKNKQTFSSVILTILHLFNDSVETNLLVFLPNLIKKTVKGAAFSIARYKLKIELFHELNNLAYSHILTIPPKLWHGFRLIAMDGSTVKLPNSKSNHSHFGTFIEKKDGKKSCLGNICMMYDVLSKYILDAEINPYNTGEVTMFHKMIKRTNLTKSIVIMDRGFGHFSAIKHIKSQNLDFCVRLKTSGCTFAKQAMENPKNDFICDWNPSKREQETCNNYGYSIDKISVRVSKIVLKSGEIELLVSSLLEIEKISLNDINELYAQRWGIEEAYKKLKPMMKLEQFSSKRWEGAYQEFYSYIFMYNITILIASESEVIIAKNTENRKYQYQYNFKTAFNLVINKFIDIFQKQDFDTAISWIVESISTSITAIRPNRIFARTQSKGMKHRFAPNYK